MHGLTLASVYPLEEGSLGMGLKKIRETSLKNKQDETYPKV